MKNDLLMDPNPAQSPFCMHIAYEGGSWLDHGISYESLAETVLSLACEAASHPNAEVSLLLTNNDRIQTLNRDYRQKDKPTNVLSFESGFLRGAYLPEGHPVFLGDIAIAYETLVAEAQEAQIPFEHHLIHLLTHGILHLLGYDHLQDDQATEMETMEINILAKLNVPNPYLVRGTNEAD